MDITDALAPVSDQLDAIELAAPRTFTIDTGSRLGQREGKTVAEIRLVDFPRVWRPSKGMLDALVGAWKTTDATQWVGHSLTLYNDTEVMFGREKTGGVRVSHVSHIDKPMTVTIRAGSGRTKPWRLQPLPDAQTKPSRKAAESVAPTAAQVAACTDRDELRAMYRVSGDEMRTQITARVAELDEGGAQPVEPDTGPGPSDADWDAMGAPDDAADGGAS
jgi:hypothetical protein